MAEWNFKSQNVEFVPFDANKIVTAESTLIAAGPPTFTAGSTVQPTSGAVGFEVYPIGLVENFGLTMGNQIQRIFEIGSAKSIIIPGRVVGTATIARIVYDSKSLLRVLYAWWWVKKDGTYTETPSQFTPISTPTASSTTDPGTIIDIDQPDANAPGYNGFWMNLDSEVFRYPIGIAVIFADKKQNRLGGVYLENCFIGGSQLTINAGTDLLAEGVNLQFTEAKPIRVNISA